MNTLQEFVTTMAARGRITFGDVRRLQRDYLPGGITTCDQAEMLIRLDTVVHRADRAWTPWLVAAILDFATRSDQPVGTGTSDACERLWAVLAAASSSKVARIVRRGRNRQVEPSAGPARHVPAQQAISFPVKPDNAPLPKTVEIPARAVLPLAFWSDRLEIAA